MIFWLPSFLMASCASYDAPSPMASIAMTEHTPKMMPSMVSTERSLWSSRLLTPSRMVLMSWNLTILRMNHFAFDQAVTHVEDAMGTAGHAFVMGDEDDGFALAVQVRD